MKRGCTQCGECLNVCPVYALYKREEYSPKGKRLLLEAIDPEFGGNPDSSMFGAGYYTVSEQLKAAFAVGIFAWLAWAATALVWFPVIGLI